jgi:hypothetical protein
MTRRVALLQNKHGDILQFSWDSPKPMMVLLSLVGGSYHMDIGKPALHPQHAAERDALELSRGAAPTCIHPEYARHIWNALVSHCGWTMAEQAQPLS